MFRRSLLASGVRAKIVNGTYATVSPTFIAQRQQSNRDSQHISLPAPSSALDGHLLSSLSTHTGTSLPDLIRQYTEQSGHVLEASLPYESRPSGSRLPSFEHGSEIAMIAHCVKDCTGESKVTVSSGFALAAPGPDDDHLILSCAHTLEEIRRSRLLSSHPQLGDRTSGSFVVSPGGSVGSLSLQPVTGVVSSLPQSDLILLRTPRSSLSTLPVSPYPAPPGTPIRAHFVSHERPQEPGWTPWVGGAFSKWVKGTVLGYRDFTGRETMPGTYDSLSHLLFSPLPTAGSSGGPIIDYNGSVVGVMLGTRMDNRIEGVRGWGVPAETIFEMFSLPGLGKR